MKSSTSLAYPPPLGRPGQHMSMSFKIVNLADTISLHPDSIMENIPKITRSISWSLGE